MYTEYEYFMVNPPKRITITPIIQPKEKFPQTNLNYFLKSWKETAIDKGFDVLKNLQKFSKKFKEEISNDTEGDEVILEFERSDIEDLFVNFIALGMGFRKDAYDDSIIIITKGELKKVVEFLDEVEKKIDVVQKVNTVEDNGNEKKKEAVEQKTEEETDKLSIDTVMKRSRELHNKLSKSKKSKDLLNNFSILHHKIIRSRINISDDEIQSLNDQLSFFESEYREVMGFAKKDRNEKRLQDNIKKMEEEFTTFLSLENNQVLFDNLQKAGEIKEFIAKFQTWLTSQNIVFPEPKKVLDVVFGDDEYSERKQFRNAEDLIKGFVIYKKTRDIEVRKRSDEKSKGFFKKIISGVRQGVVGGVKTSVGMGVGTALSGPGAALLPMVQSEKLKNIWAKFGTRIEGKENTKDRMLLAQIRLAERNVRNLNRFGQIYNRLFQNFDNIGIYEKAMYSSASSALIMSALVTTGIITLPASITAALGLAVGVAVTKTVLTTILSAQGIFNKEMMRGKTKEEAGKKYRKSVLIGLGVGVPASVLGASLGGLTAEFFREEVFPNIIPKANAQAPDTGNSKPKGSILGREFERIFRSGQTPVLDARNILEIKTSISSGKINDGLMDSLVKMPPQDFINNFSEYALLSKLNSYQLQSLENSFRGAKYTSDQAIDVLTIFREKNLLIDFSVKKGTFSPSSVIDDVLNNTSFDQAIRDDVLDKAKIRILGNATYDSKPGATSQIGPFRPGPIPSPLPQVEPAPRPAQIPAQPTGPAQVPTAYPPMLQPDVTKQNILSDLILNKKEITFSNIKTDDLNTLYFGNQIKSEVLDAININKVIENNPDVVKRMHPEAFGNLFVKSGINLRGLMAVDPELTKTAEFTRTAEQIRGLIKIFGLNNQPIDASKLDLIISRSYAASADRERILIFKNPGDDKFYRYELDGNVYKPKVLAQQPTVSVEPGTRPAPPMGTPPVIPSTTNNGISATIANIDQIKIDSPITEKDLATVLKFFPEYNDATKVFSPEEKFKMRVFSQAFSQDADFRQRGRSYQRLIFKNDNSFELAGTYSSKVKELHDILEKEGRFLAQLNKEIISNKQISVDPYKDVAMGYLTALDNFEKELKREASIPQVNNGAVPPPVRVPSAPGLNQPQPQPQPTAPVPPTITVRPAFSENELLSKIRTGGNPNRAYEFYDFPERFPNPLNGGYTGPARILALANDALLDFRKPNELIIDNKTKLIINNAPRNSDLWRIIEKVRLAQEQIVKDKQLISRTTTALDPKVARTHAENLVKSLGELEKLLGSRPTIVTAPVPPAPQPASRPPFTPLPTSTQTPTPNQPVVPPIPRPAINPNNIPTTNSPQVNSVGPNRLTANAFTNTPTKFNPGNIKFEGTGNNRTFEITGKINNSQSVWLAKIASNPADLKWFNALPVGQKAQLLEQIDRMMLVKMASMQRAPGGQSYTNGLKDLLSVPRKVSPNIWDEKIGSAGKKPINILELDKYMRAAGIKDIREILPKRK